MFKKIRLGTYPQDDDQETSIFWIPFCRCINKLYFISENILFPFWYGNTEWETSELRKYLNTKFINDAFIPYERNMLQIQKCNEEDPNFYKDGEVTEKQPLYFFDYNKTVKERITRDDLGFSNESHTFSYYILRNHTPVEDYITIPFLSDVYDSYYNTDSINDMHIRLKPHIEGKGPSKYCLTGGEYVTRLSNAQKMMCISRLRSNIWAIADKMTDERQTVGYKSFVCFENFICKYNTEQYVDFITGIRPVIAISMEDYTNSISKI